MVFRSASAGLRSLLNGRNSSKDNAGRGRPGTRTFRITVPPGSHAGQCIRVQGPDGTEVEVTIPSGARAGQAVMVEIDSTPASATTASSTSAASGSNFSAPSQGDLVALLSVMERDAGEVSAQAQQRLSEETQLQVALWASAGIAFAESEPSGHLDIQLAASKPDLSQTQAIVLAAAEVGDAAQLLAALTEAKKFSTVSLALEDAARALRSAEEALLTWRCLRKAMENKDRHEIEVWVEQANSMGLAVPSGVEKILQTLREQEEQHLAQLQQRHDVQQMLRFAQEAGDSDLLRQVQAEAAKLGLDSRAAQEQGLPGRSPGSSTPRSFTRPPAAYAGSAPSSGQAYSPSQAIPASEATSDPRQTRELLEECRSRCLDTTRCQTREDLIQLLKSASTQAAPPGANSSWQSSAASTGAATSSSLRQRATPASASPQAAGSVWDRRSVPARYKTHRQYEYLYLLGFDPARGFPSSSDLRAAYRKAAMDSHPDRQQNHARQDAAKDLFQKAKEAFDYLGPHCK